ncbi:MAG: ComF family protein [Alphaproteobacteria bacterium]|nr:ComF family protein [Alphaproteobacteria bacterium]
MFCKAQVDSELVCSACILKLPLIQSPFCQRCGQPLPQSLFKKSKVNPAVCPACRAKRFPFSQSRSVMLYDEDTSRLILRLKYGDQTHLASVFADLVFLNHVDIFRDVDVIIPVPLGFMRLMKRQYNQSALIASVLSNRTKIPLNTRAFVRKHFNKSQGGLSFQARHENVKEAFFVKVLEDIEDKVVLLVDDVMASGATLLSASRALKKAGAKEVRLITIARTV